MKNAVVVLFACLAFALVINGQINVVFKNAEPEWPALNQKKIELVNSEKLSWTASRNSKFEHLNIGEAKKFLGLKQFSWDTNSLKDANILSTAAEKLVALSKLNNVVKAYPSSFDARQQWPGCIHPVLDQGDCGSCWAFGSSESLSDRLCIDSNKSINVALSPQDLVSCAPLDGFDFACDGGLTQTAWLYMADTGLVSLDCWPYTSGQDGTVPPCRSSCVNSSIPFRRYRADYNSLETYIGEQSIQAALLSGPVEGAFMVFDDFFSYSSGVYQRNSIYFVGLHAIKIVGWGQTSAGVKYWICQNSWGTDWGMNGFFNILRGENECLIESDVVGANALV